MPKTKLEEFIFGIIMVIFMVYAMIGYNISLSSNGLSNEVLLNALKELPLTALIAFTIESLFVGKLAKKLTFSKFNPKETNPFIITISISCFTVLFMCIIMSFIATLLHNFNGIDTLFVNFVSTTVKNFPMALLYQLFFAGPVVRFIFKKVFR